MYVMGSLVRSPVQDVMGNLKGRSIIKGWRDNHLACSHPLSILHELRRWPISVLVDQKLGHPICYLDCNICSKGNLDRPNDSNRVRDQAVVLSLVFFPLGVTHCSMRSFVGGSSRLIRTPILSWSVFGVWVKAALPKCTATGRFERGILWVVEPTLLPQSLDRMFSTCAAAFGFILCCNEG